VNGIVRQLESQGESEIASGKIGELVMEGCARSTVSLMCVLPLSIAISARHGISIRWSTNLPTTRARFR